MAAGEPRVERLTVAPRVAGRTLIQVHAYRIGSTLVDAGSPHAVDRLSEEVDLDAISTVLLTHAHEDHVGLGARLAERGVSVRAPEGALASLEDPPKLPPYRRWTWGEHEPVRATPLGETVRTPDGTFRVVPAPGHAPEQVAFLETERGWLFTGDAYLGGRTIVRYTEDLVEVRASLERLRSLDATRLFPGHGRVRGAPQAALTEAIDHLDRLEREARILQREGLPVGEIRRRLLGREPFLYWFSQGEFSKTNLVRGLLTASTRKGGKR